MRWKTGRRSRNIEDQRGRRRSKLSLGGKRGGISTIIILLAAAYFGIDPAILSTLLQSGSGQVSSSSQHQNQNQAEPQSSESNELADFVITC